jgi:PAS domain S-box-containing protein
MAVKQTHIAKHLRKTVDKNHYPATPVTETLTNGFFTVDKKWTVKYWNPAAEKILKVQAADIVGKNLLQKFESVIPIELFSVDQREFVKDTPVHFRKYWSEMGAWFDVITYHCDNSLSVSFKSSKQPFAEPPEPAVEPLKVLTELYRFVTEITNDCLWEWNLLTKEIFWIDGGHKRVLGYQVENALIPQSFWEYCIHPDDKAAVLSSLKKNLVKKSASFWEATYRFKAASGSYIYVHDRGHIVRDEKGRATRIIGATQDITEKTLLEIKLANEQLTRQKLITAAVLRGQENERESIAITLNENLSQLLVATKWNIQLAKTDRDKRDKCLDNSSEYLNHVISEIRKIYKTLVIPDMHIIGLFGNIKNLVADTNKTQTVQFKFKETGIDEEEDLDKYIQQDIFRMVQEQVNNIIQHAHATAATIRLYRRGLNLILSVADNGNGNNGLTGKKGVGIINITSRAGLYGGTVLVTSKPGKGYTLKVILPCFTASC